MFSQLLPIQPVLAQEAAPPPAAPAAPVTPAAEGGGFPIMWIAITLVLCGALAGGAAYTKFKIYDKLQKDLKFERYKSQDLQKRLKLALKTIQKMEANPDLIHSREFNLDYLRLRMDEEVFHYAIVNQIKIRVKQLISVALRPSTANHQVGVAATGGRQVDETFDVTYETETRGKRTKRVLFRSQIKLTKLPTQSTSTTINQIIDCIEKFLSPNEDHDTWQPTIQGRVVLMDWDQKAKPTPLLVLEQSGEGVNVSFRTNPNRRAGGAGEEEDEMDMAVAPKPKSPGRSRDRKPPAPPNGAKAHPRAAGGKTPPRPPSAARRRSSSTKPN
ncbi:hypothetical protein PN441_07170 [Spirulina major CS-329]|uniref:hypothetical protein n=1 Tax=Spirulina TaxID=1154 RepID=UPI00232B9626|nr:MULTISPECIES: hypothetical protein [Spirulina]MDB9493864.1 hypothetical protein [Spirulina subsalsa CS-330]MDB9502847.1 hypothetical protein [Spirulina major CS-329]